MVKYSNSTSQINEFYRQVSLSTGYTREQQRAVTALHLPRRSTNYKAPFELPSGLMADFVLSTIYFSWAFLIFFLATCLFAVHGMEGEHGPPVISLSEAQSAYGAHLRERDPPMFSNFSYLRGTCCKPSGFTRLSATRRYATVKFNSSAAFVSLTLSPSKSEHK